ncbi:MAG: hypothetical protein KDA65_14510, partial [Planctomycetaceae bacterium]|nr:hypothetical protein [Planctomycetaceae bacterium]
MKRPLSVSVLVLTLCSLLFLFIPTTKQAFAEKKRLSAKYVGEYAAVPWTAKGIEITPGSRQDRVRDLNFAVSSINLNGDISPGFLQGWNQRAKLAREQGGAFLPRVYFWDGNDRFTGPLRDIDVYWNRLDTFLGAMDLENFTGIILAEENIHYAGRPEVLAELYHRVKEKYDIEVWQWWSPYRQTPSSGGWIPADGWVIDHYFTGDPAFRRDVRKYLITGKPLVIMPWAAQMDLNKEMTESEWAANQFQLDTAVEFNVPVAFFWIHGVAANFGCNRGEPQTEIDRINHWVWDYIERVRELADDYDGLESADIATGDVHEIGPTQGDRLVYSESFSDEKCVDDASMTGFRDFLLDGQALAVRGYRGRDIDCSLEYRFQGELSALEPAVQLEVNRHPKFQGKVEVAISKSGEHWIRQEADSSTQSQLRLTTENSAEFKSVQEFRVRVHITGKSLEDGSPAVFLDNLVIQAGIQAAENKQIQLTSFEEGPDRFSYVEEFLSQKYRYYADITNEHQLTWQKGKIGVRLRPGGTQVAIIWKVTAPEAFHNIQVQIDGFANRINLGTNHYLDVSS